MGWRFTHDPEAMPPAAVDFLTADPVRHTAALSILDQVRNGLRWSDEPMHFGWLAPDGGPVSGVVCLTPPFPLVLCAVPAASATGLATALADRRAPVSAVNGEPEPVEAFARAWARDGRQPWVEMRQRLYRLGRLSSPAVPVPGTGRLATGADLALVAGWWADFHAESDPHRPGADYRDAIRRRVDGGLVRLWETDGAPVAMAGRNPTVAGVCRVGPVYTPPEHRRHGYGSAATLAATEDALADGVRSVVLFTDLANPTSNGIYQAIGYRPVGDRVIVAFTRPA